MGFEGWAILPINGTLESTLVQLFQAAMAMTCMQTQEAMLEDLTKERCTSNQERVKVIRVRWLACEMQLEAVAMYTIHSLRLSAVTAETTSILVPHMHILMVKMSLPIAIQASPNSSDRL